MKFHNSIRISKDRILLSVYVTPGTNKNRFPTGYNTWKKSLEMSVKGQPEKNKANRDVLIVIAKFFNLPMKNVTIISGMNNREKTVALYGITKNALLKQLQESMDELRAST